MRLDVRPSFLTLHDAPEGVDRTLSLKPDFEGALGGWTVGSRMSPVWRLVPDTKSISAAADFGDRRVTFVGPVRPSRVLDGVKGLDQASIWASLGCFNLVISTDRDVPGEELAQRIAKWARENGVAYECWTLDAGVIAEVDQHVLPRRESDVLASLSKFGEWHQHPAVRTSYQENLVATSTILARAAAVYPPIYDEVEAAAASIVGIMEQFAADRLSLLEMQSRLLTMNAALSRFSSQAFSGIPPIRGTECHFWIHSLLGTGSANLALASLVASVQHILGQALLPERLQLLASVTSNVPDARALVSDSTLLDFDLLDATVLPTGSAGDIVPLITYFSGRDGFSSHVQTLSAPLTTLAECNSFRSNLLTVTHEISHILIQAALAVLSPTPATDGSSRWALDLVAPKAKPSNMLEAAQLLFLEAVIAMSTDDRGGVTYGVRELEKELPELIERTRGEVQEILVHAFDFLYFHVGDPEYYVSNIWHSWCAIPGIGDRVPEYLMRTLCAVSATLLTEKPDNQFLAALRETERILRKIEPQIGMAGNYVGRVLEHIERINADLDMNRKVKNQYFVRMRLVRLVRIFLFSDKLTAQLFTDPHVGGGTGYRNKRPLHYDGSPVGNALVFLRTHLKANPSEAESAWVLHALAFDLVPSPLDKQ